MSGSDYNICEFCDIYLPITEAKCTQCFQPLILEANGKIVIWRLGEIEDGVLGPIAGGLAKAFDRDVLIQPAFLDERLSARPTWKGISAGVFLDQIHRRHTEGVFANLGITSSNIVPDSHHNFLFGYAYLDLPASVISLHPLSVDDPSPTLLVDRAIKIAVHEIGHTLGLDEHSYDEDVDCVMIGDDEIDSLDGVDEGGADFCSECRRKIIAHFPNRSKDSKSKQKPTVNEVQNEADEHPVKKIPRLEKDYYVLIDGVEQKKMLIKDVWAMYWGGTINANTLYWTNDLSEWLPLRRLSTEKEINQVRPPQCCSLCNGPTRGILKRFVCASCGSEMCYSCMAEIQESYGSNICGKCGSARFRKQKY